MAQTTLKRQNEETPTEVRPHVGRAAASGVPEYKYEKKASGAAMIGHDINISPSQVATDVGMATDVSIKAGYDIKEINVVSGEDNSEDVFEAAETKTAVGSNTNEENNIEAVDAHPREDNREHVATVSHLWKKVGPDCVWASACIVTAIAAAAGFPIFGHRFTPAICVAVIAASFLSRYLVLKKCIPENLDIQELFEIRID